MRPWDPSRNSCVPVLAPDGGAFIPLARPRHWISPSTGNTVLPGGGIIDCGSWSVIARIFSDLPCPERARDRAERSWRRDSLGPLCARQWLPFVLLPVARLSMMAAPRTGLARHLRRKPLKEKRLGQAERWPSGRRRAPAKGVRVKSPSRVRIPLSPPDSPFPREMPINIGINAPVA